VLSSPLFEPRQELVSSDEDEGIKQEDKNKGSNDVQEPGNSKQEDNGLDMLKPVNKATVMALLHRKEANRKTELRAHHHQECILDYIRHTVNICA
jgi:hypothetical protein